MSNLFEMFFGPLDEKWCNLILAVAAIQLFTLATVVLGVVTGLLSGFGKLNMRDVFQMGFAIVTASVMYFLARLQYRICTAAL